MYEAGVLLAQWLQTGSELVQGVDQCCSVQIGSSNRRRRRRVGNYGDEGTSLKRKWK